MMHSTTARHLYPPHTHGTHTQAEFLLLPLRALWLFADPSRLARTFLPIQLGLPSQPLLSFPNLNAMQ